jgi:hypothetical protein
VNDEQRRKNKIRTLENHKDAAFRSLSSFPLVLVTALARKPFNSQPLISHLTNSNGCGNLSAKVADRVPVSSLLSPATRRVSATIRSPDHSVPAPNTSLPAFSSTCKSLSSHHRFATRPLSADYRSLFSQPLCFLIDTKPPGVWGMQTFNFQLCVSVPLWQIPCFQNLAASLRSLCAPFCAPSLCFQQLAASFAKTPGWGVPMPMKVKVRPVLCYSLLLPFQGASQ